MLRLPVTYMLKNAWQPTKLILYWPDTRCLLDCMLQSPFSKLPIKFDSDGFWGRIWFPKTILKVTNIYKTYFIGIHENYNRSIPLQRRLLLLIGSIKGISLNYFTFKHDSKILNVMSKTFVAMDFWHSSFIFIRW
jgi:hypothetical protein